MNLRALDVGGTEDVTLLADEEREAEAEERAARAGGGCCSRTLSWSPQTEIRACWRMVQEIGLWLLERETGAREGGLGLGTVTDVMVC
jgi:hypothetical protein